MCFASYKTKVKTGLSLLYGKESIAVSLQEMGNAKRSNLKKFALLSPSTYSCFHKPNSKGIYAFGEKGIVALSRLGHMLEIMAISLASTHGIHYNHTNKLKLDYLRSLFKALIYFSTFHASFSKSAFICHTISKPKFLSEILIQFQTFEFSCTKCRF